MILPVIMKVNEDKRNNIKISHKPYHSNDMAYGISL